MTKRQHRYAAILITPELIAEMITNSGEKTIKIEGGFPKKSKVVRCNYLPERGCFSIILEHKSFAPIKEGDPLTFIDPPIITIIDKK